MGTVRVRVGCPHRLRSPITERTGTPCDACLTFDPDLPGWPREAWAMTVDYGPRISEAATAAPAPIPPPTVTIPPEVNAVFAAMRLIEEHATSWATEAATRLVEAGGVGMGPLRFTQDESDRQRNVIHVQQEMRIDAAIADRVARSMPPRIRIVP